MSYNKKHNKDIGEWMNKFYLHDQNRWAYTALMLEKKRLLNLIQDKQKDTLKRLKKSYSDDYDIWNNVAPRFEKKRFHKLIQDKIKFLEDSINEKNNT